MTWGAVGAAAVSVVGGALINKSHSSSNKGYSQAAQQMDPYGPYRDQMAKKLNDLVNNPSSINNTPEYKARIQAAQRMMAAQGYTGSGNALVAAANAGGDAYQQAFNNLAMLSGANQAPGNGAMAAAQGKAQSNQQALQGYSGVANSLIYAGQKAYNNWSTWNTPIDTGGVAPTYSGSDISTSPITVSNYSPTMPTIPPITTT